MKKLLALSLLLLSASALALDSVEVLPLRGPVGTAKISPADGSATAYLMDYPGQKSVCFKSYAATVVFISSASTITTDGFPLEESGASLCLDLKGGTTVYFTGDGAGADVRAVFAR